MDQSQLPQTINFEVCSFIVWEIKTQVSCALIFYLAFMKMSSAIFLSVYILRAKSSLTTNWFSIKTIYDYLLIHCQSYLITYWLDHCQKHLSPIDSLSKLFMITYWLTAKIISMITYWFTAKNISLITYWFIAKIIYDHIDSLSKLFMINYLFIPCQNDLWLPIDSLPDL